MVAFLVLHVAFPHVFPDDATLITVWLSLLLAILFCFPMGSVCYASVHSVDSVWLFCYSPFSPFSPPVPFFFSFSFSVQIGMQTYQHTKCTLTVDDTARCKAKARDTKCTESQPWENQTALRALGAFSACDLFVKRKTAEQTSRQAVPDLFTVFYVMSPRGVNGWNKTYRKFKLDAKTAKGHSWTVRMCETKVWHRCPRLGWWKRPRSQTMSAFRCLKKILRYFEISWDVESVESVESICGIPEFERSMPAAPASNWMTTFEVDWSTPCEHARAPSRCQNLRHFWLLRRSWFGWDLENNRFWCFIYHYLSI